MPRRVLIANAPGEEHWAEILAEPIRQAGYEVTHSGTVLAGDSLVEEALKVLASGGPVVLCATARGVGTHWPHRLVNAARLHEGGRIFIVQMEKDAYVDILALGEKVIAYWQNEVQAIDDLVASLRSHYPLDLDPAWRNSGVGAEARYRSLLLKACNFIDLASLPKAEHHFSQAPELRQLYIPLKLKIQRNADPLPAGIQLSKHRRLVVLGEPGAGKSTLIRWLATTCLLRPNPPYSPPERLPAENLLPVVVPCRDLDPAGAMGSLKEILRQTLRAAELSKEEIRSLFPRLWDRLEKGLVLLLFDGVDELTDLQVRVRLARQIEKISMAYEQVPIVVTSRPAGYRELGFRLSPGFEHADLTELTRKDKDLFADLWFLLTEPQPDLRELKKDELIREIQSTIRIERLTGNPMLLTAMALVKDKVGKLPQRRADLYGEAVSLLLNRRPCSGEPNLANEALPQLEYLAYAMCDKGLQQITENELLALLESLRHERPNATWLRSHSPIELLRFLEGRTEILRRASERRVLGMTVPVFEFPHPTFQEYLAARALASGYFPGSSPQQSLADRVGPLAGRTVHLPSGETTVNEHWQEILQLCVACSGEAIGEVLLAILRPRPGEDAGTTARSRAILASRCLADEPRVNGETSQEVLSSLARQVSNQDGDAFVRTIFELAETRWASRLKLALAQEFQRRELAGRWSIGFVFQKMASLQLLHRASPPQQDRVISSWELEGIARALDVIGSTSGEEMAATQELVARLMEMLEESPPAAHAAAWALLSLLSSHAETWSPSTQQLDRISALVEKPGLDPGAAWGLVKLLEQNAKKAGGILIRRLQDLSPAVPAEPVEAPLARPDGTS